MAALACAAMLPGACAAIEDRPATWSYVYTTIIQPNCTSSNCHSGSAGTGGLRFESLGATYVYLTGRLCDPLADDGAADHNFVVPYDPERSKLMYMLRGESTWRMPPDVALPAVEIELVERWILEGAQCN
jgi:hypothetical protein